MIYVALFNSPKFPGGVEQVAANVASGIAQIVGKDQVTIICSTKDEIHDFSGISVINLPHIDFGIFEKLFRLSRFYFAFKLFKFLKTHTVKDDVVNIHGHEYSLFVRCFREHVVVKVFVSVHGSFFDAYKEYVINAAKESLKTRILLPFFYLIRYYFYLLEKININSVDGYTFITKYLQDFYTEVLGLNTSSKVIYNGLNKNDLNLATGYFTKGDCLEAIIVGSSVIGKGLNIAVDAISEYNKKHSKKINLRVIGFKDFTSYYSEVPPNVVYVGRVEPSKILVEYMKSDFLIFPSRNEGFPLTILESLSAGKPVLVSKNCKFNEIENYRNLGIVVSDYDLEEWVTGLEKMIEGLSTFDVKSNFKKESYDWGKIINEYYGFLK